MGFSIKSNLRINVACRKETEQEYFVSTLFIQEWTVSFKNAKMSLCFFWEQFIEF